MTASEDKILKAVTDFREEQGKFNATIRSEQGQMRQIILDHEKALRDLDAIRNKGIGAIWLGGILGGTGFLASIGAIIYSLTKH